MRKADKTSAPVNDPHDCAAPCLGFTETIAAEDPQMAGPSSRRPFGGNDRIFSAFDSIASRMVFLSLAHKCRNDSSGESPQNEIQENVFTTKSRRIRRGLGK